MSPDRIRLVAAARPNLLAMVAFGICILNSGLLSAQSTPPAVVVDPASAPCTRPVAGASIAEPADLRSHHGELHVTLTVTRAADGQGHVRYCYLDPEGHEAPTLRVRPGDTLYLKLLRVLPARTGVAAADRSGNAD